MRPGIQSQRLATAVILMAHGAQGSTEARLRTLVCFWLVLLMDKKLSSRPSGMTDRPSRIYNTQASTESLVLFDWLRVISSREVHFLLSSLLSSSALDCDTKPSTLSIHAYIDPPAWTCLPTMPVEDSPRYPLEDSEVGPERSHHERRMVVTGFAAIRQAHEEDFAHVN